MSAKQQSPVGKLGMSVALRMAQNAEAKLEQLYKEVKLLRLFATQRRYFTLPLGGQALAGESQFHFEPIAAGYTFIVDRITCSAPKKARLEIYEGAVQASQFLEVIPAATRYAAIVGGTMPIEGPSNLIAVFTEAEAEGPFAITLGGLLIPTQPRDTIHTRTSVLQ